MNGGVAASLGVIPLLIGAGLVAVGLLSFLDIHFFKTRLQDKVALAVGLAFILATEALFVTSSGGGRYFEGQKADVTDCEYEVERAHPLERRANPGLIRDEIVKCMDRLAYEWTLEHKHCQQAKLATNAFCYLPKDAFPRAIASFQMKFE